jgi:hypothetical protein
MPECNYSRKERQTSVRLICPGTEYKQGVAYYYYYYYYYYYLPTYLSTYQSTYITT